MKAPDEQPPLPLLEQPESAADTLPPAADDPLAEARVRRHLRAVLKPLAYCRPPVPDNDNGRRR